MDIKYKLTIKENIRNLIRMAIKCKCLWEHIVQRISKDFTWKMGRNMIKEAMKLEKTQKEKTNFLISKVLK